MAWVWPEHTAKRMTSGPTLIGADGRHRRACVAQGQVQAGDVLAALPTATPVWAEGESGTSKPSKRSPARSRVEFSRNRTRKDGSPAMSSSRFRGRRATGAGGALAPSK